ncbi:MAG: antitoxin [Blastococcus sp.]
MRGTEMDIGGLGDKAKDFLDSEQGEQRSDQALDKAAELADEKTGGTYDQQVEKGRDAADERIGESGCAQPGS